MPETASLTAKTLPWWVPEVGTLELELVRQVLETNYINEGEVTTQFEQAIARRLGAKHAVAATNCTSALFLALKAVGVGPGDEVVVPDITFIATANAVSLTGAKAVLVDVDPATLNMAPEAFARVITRRTKAVLPVHVSGRAANLPALQQLAEKHGIVLIEDAAEALLSKAYGKFLGTIGKAGCISFSPNKTITTGQGGIILTDDDQLHIRLRELKDQGRPVRGTGGDDIHPSIGFNFKLTNVQAAIGMGQLSRLEERVAQLRQIYEMYEAGLAGISGIRLPGFHTREGETPQWVDAVVERRDELDLYLAARDIHCRRFWFPVHTQAPYRLPDGDFPHSTRLCARALWLPSAFTMRAPEVELVCRHIRAFFTSSPGGRL
jgi:perosamine synthetase